MKFYYKKNKLNNLDFYLFYNYFPKDIMSSSTKFISSAGSLVQLLIRQKNKQNITNSFSKIKSASKYKTKRDRYLSLLLCKLYQKFKKNQNQKFFNLLIQNHIESIQKVKSKLNSLQIKSKQLALTLIVGKQKNLQKNMLINSFNTLRFKSSIYNKIKSFKILYLINTIKSLQKRYFIDSMKLIRIRRFQILCQYKRMHLIFNLLINKRKQFLSESFQILKYNKTKFENNNMPKIMIKSDSKADFKQQKQYHEKKTTLELEISFFQKDNINKKHNKQKQIQKLQNDLQSIKFSYDLLEEDNQGLQKAIQQRQNMKKIQKNKQSGKEKYNQDNSKPIQIKQGKVWKNIVCNLIKYLSKVQNEINPQKLMQSICEPLVHTSFYSSISQLKQQNQILSQILQAYTQQNDTDYQLQQSNICLPMSCLNKQKRQFYKILQCLSRWGSSDTQELRQIKLSLQKLKKINTSVNMEKQIFIL